MPSASSIRFFTSLTMPRCLMLAVVAALAVLSAAARDVTDKELQQVLSQLDHELANGRSYRARRVASIDSLRNVRDALRSSQMPWLENTMKIAQAYSGFNNDSALYYYSEGLQAAVSAEADSMIVEFRLRRATYMTISGFINDAVEEYEKVDTANLSPGLKKTFYASGRQMYSYISNYYHGFISTYDYWNNKAVEAQRNLLGYLPEKSVPYKLNLGEYLFHNREYLKSRQVLLDLIEQLPQDTPQYPIACHILAQIAGIRGDRNAHLYYLALSAIGDAKMATLEVTSLQELGGELFELGDTKRAHTYLMQAMENVVDSRASVRLLQTSELLNVVENDHLRQISQWRLLTNIIIIILVLTLLALGASMVALWRHVHRLEVMKTNLEEANKTKEVYISQFLTLCSIYIDKLKQFTKLVNRKISAGQTDELSRLTRSPKFIEEQSREFYSVFDSAFLHIYPSFVEKVNLLLRPDQQITLPEGEMLNSELRILAFMRLGIDDTMRVAQILNYSVNTIYAYRNKLRNKAINRDTFEADILKISSQN